MSNLDWIILVATLLSIIIYGIYKGRSQKTMEGYLLAGRSLPWYSVMFSVMATQASAITFLSAPGQAYTDGMRFVQFYFGLPIAMVVICIFFLPRFHNLNVYTAYEFLEKRFDLRTRVFTAILFLVQRGLAAGFTIYAPSLILSTLLGWNIYWTNVFMGGLVVIHTMAGGSKAVSFTQMQQMIIILAGMFTAGWLIVDKLPEGVGFSEALHVAGKAGRLNALTFNVDLNDRYNLWSGLIGGFFLALSYFGTDQSQVGRYLSGRSVTQSRVGLLMNGMVKIPMQFLILMIGALLVAFYYFNPAPLLFNGAREKIADTTAQARDWQALEKDHILLFDQKKEHARQLVDALHHDDQGKVESEGQVIRELQRKQDYLRDSAQRLVKIASPSADNKDTNYIFLHFVIHFLPAGIVGLLIAVIFCASWNSTSSELNALASTTVVDFYRRIFRPAATEKNYVNASRVATVAWGGFAVLVAGFCNRMGSLIEAVNILGSLFYGTILGVFMVAFFMKKVKGRAVFIAAIITEAAVITCFLFNVIAFLWLNLLGCALVMGLAWILQQRERTGVA